MGFFSKDIKTMDDLLLHGLQDIYYAEKQITKALPKMIDKATNRDLAKGLKTISTRPRSRSSGWTRCSRSSARSREARMPGDRRPDQGTDEIAGEVADKRCSMPRSSPPRRRSNIMKLPATAR